MSPADDPVVIPSGEGPPRRRERLQALVLAAGESRRMPGVSKLLESLEGRPLVARVVDMLLVAGLRSVTVVVGHAASDVADALGDREVSIVRHPGFAGGLSTSLRRGLGALPSDASGVLIALGDMPLVEPDTVRALVGAFVEDPTVHACVPVLGGVRGNPVLLGSRFFPMVDKLRGDRGARTLLSQHPELVREVAVEDPGVLIDVDTESDLGALRGSADGS